MPKKQTKRSLVVNGRQEGFTLPYFDDYATNLINGIKLRQEAVASAQQAYNALRDRQTREFLNNVNTQQSKSSTSIQKQAKASHTAQTDKTFVPAVGRRQNPELDAIPVKEDNTGPLGYAAAIAPFAVASAPFAAATPTAFANPYVQAGINSYFAAEGVDDIINGRANWSTPINFLPFYGGATKTLANAVGKAYNSGKKAYDTTRLAIGLNNDIRKFTPRYTLKNPRYDIMAAKQGFTPDGISWAEATKPYEIAHYPGYQLKSLMIGNPLEKQLSRWGQINVNNVKALINKGSNVEKVVVDKVLNSKQFAGKKSIDYNKFRKAVQDELITYDRVPNKKYEDYGIDRLGYKSDRHIWDIGEDSRFQINDEGLPVWADTGVPLTQEERAMWINENMPHTNTFTFESPRIPQGDATHYSSSTLGHSRTYTTPDEPDVLHVMESQSDWAQRNTLKRKIKYLPNEEQSLQNYINIANNGYIVNGRKLNPTEIASINRIISFQKPYLKRLRESLGNDMPQQLHLSDNYLQRQLQENLKYAAEQGQAKMRYPTRETAAKIEGYAKNKKYRERSFEEQKELDLLNARAIHMRFIDGKTINNSSELADINMRRKFLTRPYDIEYGPKEETILKKYSDFPKQYRKLYKNADVRTVTDGKGNTWYEVDVPKDYLNREWQYSLGGQLRKRSLKSVKHMF